LPRTLAGPLERRGIIETFRQCCDDVIAAPFQVVIAIQREQDQSKKLESRFVVSATSFPCFAATFAEAVLPFVTNQVFFAHPYGFFANAIILIVVGDINDSIGDARLIHSFILPTND